MKLKLTIETHPDLHNGFAAQVLLNGQVVHEDYGTNAGVAAVNARDSFVLLLRRSLKEADNMLGLDG